MDRLFFYNLPTYVSRIITLNLPINEFLAYPESVNFNPGNGITTTLSTTTLPMDYNYLEVNGHNYRGRHSRWFITGYERLSAAMWQLTLVRDILAEKWSDLKSSRCLISRSNCLDNSNPLIYQSEAITVNRIKEKEIPVTDDGLAWVVGYFAANTATKETVNVYSKDGKQVYDQLEGSDEYIPATTQVDKDILDNTLAVTINAGDADVIKDDHTLEENYPYNYFFSLSEAGSLFMTAKFNVVTYSKTYHINMSGYNAVATNEDYSRQGYQYFSVKGNRSEADVIKNVIAAAKEAFSDKPGRVSYTYLKNIGSEPTGLNADDFSETMKINGRKLQFGEDGTYYAKITTLAKPSAELPDDRDNVSLQFEEALTARGIVPNLRKVKLLTRNAMPYCYKLEFQQIPATDDDIIKLDKNKWQPAVDAPYVIKAIPFVPNAVVTHNGNAAQVITEGKAVSLRQSIGKALGSFCYDVQVLPYRQFANITNSNDNINDSQLPAAIKEDVIGLEKKQYYGTMYTVLQAKFSKTLDLSAMAPDLSHYSGRKLPSKKLEDVCTSLRLVSPNFNGTFEWSIAKNDEHFDYFDVDCLLKPYQPYIHVAPRFHGLYGYDFNDARGLTCGGDFGITRITDAWQEYQIQNKNYQSRFDREIQSLDTQWQYQNQSNIANAISGVVGAAASTSIGGWMSGYASAGMAGALIGGAASAIGGAMDVNSQNALFQEQKNLKRDSFARQLGNIKALPYSLTKISSITPNYKYFPIVEWYECTPDEISYVDDTLYYGGRSVGVKATLSNFIDDTKADGYIVAAIDKMSSNIPNSWEAFASSELNKGVYVDGNSNSN